MDQHTSAPQEQQSFPPRYFATIAIGALAALIIDQCSKIIVRREMPLGLPHPVISGWLDFTHAQNFGAAWSMLSGQRMVLVVVTLVVIGIMLSAARELASNGLMSRIGLGLVLGGALGNLVDRLLLGHVTDFIDLGSPWQLLATFPIFNIADSCLTVGAILLAWSYLFQSKRVD